MAFDFPNSPTIGQQFVAGTVVFQWDGIAWNIVPLITPPIADDDAPANPYNGQLWWNANNGNLYVWYDDGNSAAWVQTAGNASFSLPPSDDGEYAMVNGVWRLKSQRFDLTGLAEKKIAVPDWQPSWVRISTACQSATASGQAMQLSSDGTTFAAASTDYAEGGFVHYTGATAPGIVNVPNAAGSRFALTGTHQHATLFSYTDCKLQLTRRSSTALIGWVTRGDYYNTIATFLNCALYYSGYATVASVPGPVKALRWFSPEAVAATAGEINLEWMA